MQPDLVEGEIGVAEAPVEEDAGGAGPVPARGGGPIAQGVNEVTHRRVATTEHQLDVGKLPFSVVEDDMHSDWKLVPSPRACRGTCGARRGGQPERVTSSTAGNANRRAVRVLSRR
jgi:hypothetical protein